MGAGRSVARAWDAAVTPSPRDTGRRRWAGGSRSCGEVEAVSEAVVRDGSAVPGEGLLTRRMGGR